MRAVLSSPGEGKRVGFCNSNSLVLSDSAKLVSDSLQSDISTLVILR